MHRAEVGRLAGGLHVEDEVDVALGEAQHVLRPVARDRREAHTLEMHAIAASARGAHEQRVREDLLREREPRGGDVVVHAHTDVLDELCAWADALATPRDLRRGAPVERGAIGVTPGEGQHLRPERTDVDRDILRGLADLVDVSTHGGDRTLGDATRADAEDELPVAHLVRGARREREHRRGVARDRDDRDPGRKTSTFVPGDTHRDRVVIDAGICPEALVTDGACLGREVAELRGGKTETRVEAESDLNRSPSGRTCRRGSRRPVARAVASTPSLP